MPASLRPYAKAVVPFALTVIALKKQTTALVPP